MSKRKNNAIKSPQLAIDTSHDSTRTTTTTQDGHVVYPELLRPQTRLESISRTVRSLFATNPQSSSTTAPAHLRSYGAYASTALQSSNTIIPEESTNVNKVIWSSWASVLTRTLLLVAYDQAGFHIWDFTQLDNAKEILHLPSIGPVISATIVVTPSQKNKKSPTLFLLTGSREDATLTIYSLTNQTLLKRISVPNARTLQANERFIVLGVDSASSNDPSKPAIHILSSNPEYKHLHTIPSSSISPHSLSNPIFSLSPTRLLAYASSEPPVHLQPTKAQAQQQQEASSYPPSNPFPFTPLPASPNANAAHSQQSSTFSTGLSIVGSTVLTGAMRLGTGVLEGVKMGINAAGYGTDNANAEVGVGVGVGASGNAPGDERGIEVRRSSASKSAPAPHVSPLAAAAAAAGRGHFHSRRASAQVRSVIPNTTPGTNYLGTTDGGEWIVVLDLQPLLSRAGGAGGMDHRLQLQELPPVLSPVALSPTSSFLVTSPPLTHLSAIPSPSPNTNPPHTVVEFPYTTTSTTTTKLEPHPHPHSRASPSKYGASPSKYGLPTSTSRLSPNTSRPSTPNTASKAITSLKWSGDGALLSVGGVDGGSVRVFGVSRGRGVGVRTGAGGGGGGGGEARLVYELLRGVTPASILDICWSSDGLWCGFVSDKGTLHVYAVHPQGGETDGMSQIYGRVLNHAKRPLPTTRVQALARLRQPLFSMDQEDPSVQQGHATADTSSDPGSTAATLPIFTFLPANTSRSSSRLPIPPEQRSPPTSLVNLHEAGIMSTDGDAPPTGFNDALVFLPEENRVVLWRCTLRPPPTSSSSPGTKSPAGPRRIEPSPSIVGDAPVSPTVPGGGGGGGGGGGSGGVGGLPGSLPIGGGVLSGVARMTGLGLREGGLASALSRGGRLTVETGVLASWDMRRGDAWPEVKSAIWGEKSGSSEEPSRRSYVSHAEITTFHSKSSTAPRPIYLSHQFNFFSLMNDYQALVRRLVLDPPTYPVAMRKESVVVRGGDDLLSLHPRDSRTSLPGDFDSDANFLGATTNMGPLDLADSPLLGGHLGLPMEGVPLSSSLASTNVTSHSSQSRNGRRIVGKSFDDGLSSAMESNLELHASYSPSGSSSDVASPGHVIPMLPNGRPGSSGSGVSAGLDAVVRSTTRVGKDMWSGLGHVRSPRLMPTKRTSASADLLKFDEEEEMFVVDGLEETGVTEGASHPASPGTRREGSLATIGPGIGLRYPLTSMTDSGLTVIGPATGTNFTGTPGEEGTWVEQPEVYAQAVEEDARFDDVTKVLEEEREERRAIYGAAATPASMTSSIVSESGKGKRKGGKKKKR